QSCHRPGQVGPFSLMSYEQAVKWGADVAAAAQGRQMPPWKAERDGRFRNERGLTDQQIATLVGWVEAGTPAGDPASAKPKSFADGWHLGPPDLILEVPED